MNQVLGCGQEAAHNVSSARPRLLAVVSRFKWVHIDYLAALEEHFDVFVAWSGEGGKRAPLAGLRAGMRGLPIGWIPDLGTAQVRARLQRVIAAFRPDLVHVMYYNHEDLTLLVREIVGGELPIVFECRDPLTTLTGASPGHADWKLERDAILASDRQILISAAQRDYYESAHELDLGESSLVIPYAFRGSGAAPPSPKLSSADGRTHIALVGTADAEPDHGRWYVEIIRRLVGLGFVVHSHFWDLSDFGVSLEPYVALAQELADYHHHPTISYRRGTELSSAMSRYDLMGVFHELEAAHHNESATLAVCLPTKAVCGWFHGAIPVVCFPHYRGIVERIDEFGIGFVVESWEELGALSDDHAAIAAASERCLAVRSRFTTERAAERIAEFVSPLHARDSTGGAVVS
ncbi:MAG: glycosyltransferase [Solirubrobacterales bacterium]|nr:glycosyltransferase [Solirubrobacterales bacterium]